MASRDSSTRPNRGRDQPKKVREVPTFSAVLEDGSIVEAVYWPEERVTRFCVYHDGAPRYEERVPLGNRSLVPYSPHNNLLRNGVVLLPSQPEEYGSVAELVAEIQAHVHRYVQVSPLFEKLTSYYVLLTWIYDAFNALPYLRLLGDAGSGKTRFLLTVGSLCYKPIFASGASTVSPLFRILDSVRGTLIIDEGDFRFSDEKAELVKILNCGNAKGVPVLRSEVSRSKEVNPQSFVVYGPKLVATRGFFEDRALESRCLTEEMGFFALRDEIPINLPDSHRDEALELRNKLLLFRFRTLGSVEPVADVLDSEIEPRLRQIFAPLMSVIEDPEARNELASVARQYHDDLVAERGLDIEAQVLEVIHALIEAGHRLVVKEIASWFADRYGDQYRYEITPKWVGGRIRKKLHLKTRKSHGVYEIPKEEQPKLERLFQKYGIGPNDPSRLRRDLRV